LEDVLAGVDGGGDFARQVLEAQLQREADEVKNNYGIGVIFNKALQGKRKRKGVMASLARAFGRQPADIEQCGRIAARWSKDEINAHLDAKGNWAELVELERLGNAVVDDGKPAAKVVLEESRTKRFGPGELRQRVNALKPQPKQPASSNQGGAGSPGSASSAKPGPVPAPLRPDA
jgi:hypothetical protein